MRPNEVGPGGNAPRVSVEVLHELHHAFLVAGPAHLFGIAVFLIVPDGAGQSLPFGMLVASPPPAIATDADYRQLDWLDRRLRDVGGIPAVGSIKGAAPVLPKRKRRRKPFAELGDPLVGEGTGRAAASGPEVDIATVCRGSKARGAAGQKSPRHSKLPMSRQ